MTIAELGSVGEFIASIGVLITLIVLVLETRNNTRILVRSNARATYDQEGDALRAAMDGGIPDNAWRLSMVAGANVLVRTGVSSRGRADS